MRNDRKEMPREYADIIINTFMNGRSGNLQVTDATNTLHERLLSACTRPRIRELLRHMWKDCEKIIPIGMMDLDYLADADEQVPARPASQGGKGTGLRTGGQRPHKKKK